MGVITATHRYLVRIGKLSDSSSVAVYKFMCGQFPIGLDLELLAI
jgi:hypothetical protein